MPTSDLTWNIRIYHCPSNCHTHDIETLAGTGSGAISAPDHTYPSLLWIQLTATDSLGLSSSASVYLYPKTSDLTATSSPSGLTVGLGADTCAAPVTATFFQGGTTTLSAPSLQTLNGTQYGFVSWSDGGAATHAVDVPASTTTYVATYAAMPVQRLDNATYPDLASYPTTATAPTRRWSRRPSPRVPVGLHRLGWTSPTRSGRRPRPAPGAPVLLVTPTAIPAATPTR